MPVIHRPVYAPRSSNGSRPRYGAKALGWPTLALAVVISVLAAPAPASAATYKVEFSGVVICDSSSWPVKGVWVQNANGSDGFARWWAMPGKSNAAKYSISLTASRPDPSIRLDVGCGGGTASWKKTLLTPDFRTRHGYTENRSCTTASANRSRACTPAPKGPTASGSLGDAGYCTDGAYRKFKAFTGYWPAIGGHANQMDDRAQADFFVSSVPHAKSIVVFNSAAPPLGHVGWVTKVYKLGSTVKFDYIDMNGGSGGTVANRYHTSLFDIFDTKTGVTWNPSDQRFIVAPT